MAIRGNPLGHPIQPSGKVLVISGNSRRSGKTSLAVEILRSFPDLQWTAVKISGHADGGCRIHGARCHRGTNEHTFSLSEECGSARNVDTARFLAAGAARAFWLQVKPGCLADAWPQLCSQLDVAGHVILESNAAASLLRTCLHLAVLDLRRPDFRLSFRNTLSLVDAFVLRDLPNGKGSSAALSELGRRPIFVRPPG